MITDETSHLVVIDDSSNDAETVSNMLRNAGHAVRTSRVEDVEALRRSLREHRCDMILVKPGIPGAGAAEILRVTREGQADLPVIVLDTGIDPQQVTIALEAGVSDVVAISDPVRLEHALLRELRSLQDRRRLAHCERMLQDARERAQALVESSRDAIAYVHDGTHIYANHSYLEMFGYADFSEIEGMPILNMVSPDDHAQFKEFLRGYAKRREQAAELEVRGLRADATEFTITLEFSPTSYEGEKCTQIVIRDRSAAMELERRLDDLSKLDLLTGLFNRQYFLSQLHGVVSKTTRQGALLYIEPDNTKAVRDQLGITAFDAALTEMGHVLKGLLPGDGDILARFETNVFTALLLDVDAAVAVEVARRLVQTVEKHVVEVAGSSVSLTCSVGIALFADGTGIPQEILTRSERARRKVTGGNGFHLYNPAAEELAEKELANLWARQIKLALRDNQFQLVFQPIVSLHGDANENYEVFIRMMDDDRRHILPGDFIPAAEKVGLMGAVDRWVIGHAVKILAERKRQGRKTTFFVKISADSLREPRTLPWLRELLAAAKLEGPKLVIEVAAEVAYANLKLFRQMEEGLKGLDIKVALDHLGSLPNAVNLLRHCEPDFVKLDKSLINGLAKSPPQQQAVKELTGLAKQMRTQTIAEFVEDANTLAVIWSCGVDYIQGYFLQQPGPELSYDFTSMEA